jgi:hypothetical protein
MSFRLGRVMACCMFAAIIQGAVAQDLPRKQFELRVEETGTRLGRAAARAEGLPLNRRYAELDANEKAIVRANYEGMPEADEPPFPADGLLPIFKALHRGVEKDAPLGVLTLVADVDSSGKVRHVDSFGKLDADFARFASRVLAGTAFKPAVCAGKPCNMQYVLRVQFGLL